MTHPSFRSLIAPALMLLLEASFVSGQERPAQETGLPRWVAEDVINFFNDPATIHFSGRTRIPSTRVVVGDVASLGGPFTIAGEVQGDLVVVNGDLVFESGGSVSGDVLVVGGRILGEELGTIGGNIRVFDQPLRYVQEGEEIRGVGRPEEGRGIGPEFPWGEARLTVEAGKNYNRVEGLPVMFGPSIRTTGPNPLRLDLFAIWRTEMGLDLGEEDFGYQLSVDQSLGGRRRVAIGATLFSRMDPIEEWGLSNLEASLATFVLHRDFRDYFERTGWSAYVRFRFPFYPVEIKAEYKNEDHRYARVVGPWSLTRNNEPWRPQPLAAEGDLRSLSAALVVDTRNRPSSPSDGWYIQATAEAGIGGRLAVPRHFASPETTTEFIDPMEVSTDFLTGFVDARSYNRINPGASLNLRALFAGGLTDEALAPQFQHALGGVGSLPGYHLFHGDCGARATRRAYESQAEGVTVRDEVFSSYGCNAIVLFQAEFRGSLFVDWSLGGGEGTDPWQDDWTWYPSVELSPSWVAFFDLGRGWNPEGPGTGTMADVGLGVLLGDLGAYFAFPLTKNHKGERSGTFFLRLNRRF